MPIRRETWWEERTTLERCLIKFCLLSAVIVTVGIITLLTTKLRECPPAHEAVETLPNFTCLTNGCVKSSADLLRNMDLSVKPCNDFYNFACGNFIKKAKISHDKTYVNTFTIINDLLQEQLRLAMEEPIGENEPTPFKSLKKYYRACTNKALIEANALQTAKQLLVNLGGWPVLEGTFWNEYRFDWKTTMFQFRKIGLGIDTLFDLSVGFDLKNSNRRIIQLDQPTLGISREYLINGLQDKISRAYYSYMVDIAVLFGANTEAAIMEMKEAFIFETKLARYSLSQEERRNITNLYNVMTVGELISRFPTIPWLHYFNTMLEEAAQVERREIILLGVPKFMGKLVELLDETPRRVQANYLMWRSVMTIIPYLNDNIRKRQLQFAHTVNGIEESAPRWRECIDETEKILPVITGALYVRKYFDQPSKKNAVNMVGYIKEEFKNILKTLDWMEDDTRKSALEKADAVVDHIGYPDELLDDKKLEEVFQSLEVQEDQYLYSMLNISLFGTEFSFNRLRKPVNKTDWMDHSNTALVNAFYHPLENSIIIPAGILQGMLFSSDRPNYMNYGAIGSVIGHEITHGFDDTGRLFDKDGNLVDWWEPHTQKAFLKKAACIIDQYANYTVTEINLNINGIKTQGENIADNGGIKEAYLAYNTWVKKNGPEGKLPGLEFTPNQLFWISAAQNWCSKHRAEAVALQVTTDVHAPEEFRVLGPFSNLEYFAKDFRCSLGTKMNPVKKCSVW